MVYRVGVLPDVRASASIWRDVCRREGIGELYLCAAKTYETGDPDQYGFDAVVEFPPHGVRTPPINAQVEIANPDFEGQIVDYRRFVLDALARPELPYRVHRTVMPGWDNTARRPNHPLTFVNATPEIYELWLRELVARAREQQRGDEQLVFINAWNEWAEAAHLEPDQRFGGQLLEATRRALVDAPVGDAPFCASRGGCPTRHRRGPYDPIIVCSVDRAWLAAVTASFARYRAAAATRFAATGSPPRDRRAASARRAAASRGRSATSP